MVRLKHSLFLRVGVSFLASLALVAVVAVVSARAVQPQSSASTVTITRPAGMAPLLPGEGEWGAYPSYLFGTVDTQAWDLQHNLETMPNVQQQLKQAHFTLMRTFIFQNNLYNGQPVSDQEILAKVQALQNAGMVCMIDLWTANTMAFDEHVVRLLGNRCNYYEFMNEPDDEQVQLATYMQDWNSEIPKLRAINAHALFGGPVLATPGGWQCSTVNGQQMCFMQKFLQAVAASHVMPDFITYHDYPCWQQTGPQCVPMANTYADHAREVLGWEKQYLGKLLPTGVTEWNTDPGGPKFILDPSVITPYIAQALLGMQEGGLSFANYFDCCNYGGYGNFDLFDVEHNGTPNPSYAAIKQAIADVYRKPAADTKKSGANP